MRDESQAKRVRANRTAKPAAKKSAASKNRSASASGAPPATDAANKVARLNKLRAAPIMPMPPVAPREPIYLASQLASICDVDLKTIHNWCDRAPSEQAEPAELECFRTPGGHLRFRHSAVLRFLNRWGYPIPDALLRDRPHMLLIEPDARLRERVIQAMELVRPGEEDAVFDERPTPEEALVNKRGKPESEDPTLGLFANLRWYVHIWDDPYAALVAVGERTGAGATLDLAVLGVPMLGLDERAWMRAMRDRPSTHAMRFVLVGHDDKRASAADEHGVVGSVPRQRLDQLRTLLDDQSAQIMAAIGDRVVVPTTRATPGQRKRRAPIAPREPIFVASQVANIWNVDLKTVHNWVDRGDIEAFCTPGRHLRFRRRSLLHFLRRYNMAIPEEIAPHRPRVIVVDTDGRNAKQLLPTLTDLFEVAVLPDPVSALAEIGTQCSGANLVDAVVVSFPVEGVDDRRWIQALARHPDTRYSRVVVVSLEDAHRKDWQDMGAIATVQRNSLEQVAPVLEKALGLNQ